MKFEWIYLACMLETTIICFGSMLLNISLTKAYRKEFPCRQRRLHVPDYWHISSVKELISRKGSMYIQYMKQNHWALTETSKCEVYVLPSHLYSGWRLFCKGQSAILHAKSTIQRMHNTMSWVRSGAKMLKFK